MTSISTIELHQKILAGGPLRLLDVRTPAEFAGAHIPQAVLEPLDALDPATLTKTSGEDLYVICQSGTRARSAIKKLEAAGLSRCVLVDGGMTEWLKAGFAVERHGGAIISLERQVRIAAGALVLAGILPGVLVSPLFLLLSAFVGGGLVFAGITDKCGMGMLLARMPWNQVKIGSSCACASHKPL
jgi:rhodanese-related sulfurtransferase